MLKKGNDPKKEKHYSPRPYRRMAIIFTLLSVMNMIAVFVAFNRAGYGLWYAESGLSHIAQIDQYVQSVNEHMLHIVMHKNEKSVVLNDIYNIEDCFKKIKSESAKYHEIDLSKVDPSLMTKFDSMLLLIDNYEAELTNVTNQLRSSVTENGVSNPEYLAGIENTYTTTIEPMKTETESTVNSLFRQQNEASEQFFYACAKQFVFVLLFLIATMAAGLVNIVRMRSDARAAAKKIETEHQKVEKSRAKSMDIAMTNILTGFKNRYGLESDIAPVLKEQKFTIAFYRFLDLPQIYEKYGRGAADDYIVALSQTLNKSFGDAADIYSTETDEFCFVFKRDLGSKYEEDIMYRIARALARQVDLQNVSIQCNVYGCYYHCEPGFHTDCLQMINRVDKAMAVARQQAHSTGQNTVWCVNNM